MPKMQPLSLLLLALPSNTSDSIGMGAIMNFAL